MSVRLEEAAGEQPDHGTVVGDKAGLHGRTSVAFRFAAFG
jgi:hypothetical protein